MSSETPERSSGRNWRERLKIPLTAGMLALQLVEIGATAGEARGLEDQLATARSMRPVAMVTDSAPRPAALNMAEPGGLREDLHGVPSQGSMSGDHQNPAEAIMHYYTHPHLPEDESAKAQLHNPDEDAEESGAYSRQPDAVPQAARANDIAAMPTLTVQNTQRIA